MLTSLGPIPFHPSLVMNTPVSLAGIHLEIITLPFTITTHCGMVRGVDLLAVSVGSTPLHGSVSLYLNLPQMTWR